MIVLLSHFLLLIILVRWQRRSRGCWSGGHALIVIWLILFWSMFALGMVPFWRSIFYINIKYYWCLLFFLNCYITFILSCLIIISMSPYSLESISWWSFHAQYCKQIIQFSLNQLFNLQLLYTISWFINQLYLQLIDNIIYYIILCALLYSLININLYIISTSIREPGYLCYIFNLTFEKFLFYVYWNYGTFLNLFNNLILLFLIIILMFYLIVIINYFYLINEYCAGILPRFLYYRLNFNLYYHQDKIFYEFNTNSQLEKAWYNSKYLNFYDLSYNCYNFHGGSGDWFYKYNVWRLKILAWYRHYFLIILRKYDLDIFYVFGYYNELNLTILTEAKCFI